MTKFKKAIAVSLVCMMLAVPVITAFGDELPPPEPESPYDDSGEQTVELVNVILPAEIPFEIVLVENRKDGIVASKEFRITNTSENDVTVKISSINLEISDEDNFAFSDSEDLPKEGSNIYMELICSSGGETKALPVTSRSADTDFTYYLESGEIGTFRLSGTVNEFGDIAWSDVSAIVSVNFSMENHGAVIESLRAERRIEKEEPDNADNPETSSEPPSAEEPAFEPSASEPPTPEPESAESGENADAENSAAPEAPPEPETSSEPEASSETEASPKPETSPEAEASSKSEKTESSVGSDS